VDAGGRGDLSVDLIGDGDCHRPAIIESPVDGEESVLSTDALRAPPSHAAVHELHDEHEGPVSEMVGGGRRDDRRHRGDDDMKVYTEARSDTGGKLQSGRLLTTC
jgi:hypothetical protein